MPVLCRLLVNRALQVQLLDDVARAEVEVLHHDLGDILVGETAHRGTVSINVNAQGVGEADSVGNLNESAVSQLVRDDRLGDVASVVGRRSVDLGWVLAGEGTATVGRPATVGIDDDLATSEACVSIGSTEGELTRGVDDDFGVNEEVLGDDLLDHLLVNGGPDGLVVDTRVVLLGDQDVVDANRGQLAIALVLVLENDLGFSIRTEPWDLTTVAHLGEGLAELVGQVVGVGVQDFRVPFVGGVSKHEALVAGAEVCFLLTSVDAVGDLSRLWLHVGDDLAVGAVESNSVARVPNLRANVAGNLLVVDSASRERRLTEKHDLKISCE